MKKKFATAIVLAMVFIFTTFSGQFITITMASADGFDSLSEDSAQEDDDDDDDANDSGYHRADPTDWSAKSELIATALQTPGVENVDILTGDSFEVPTEILSSIAGKDITLALHAGNGLAFSVSGRNVGRTDTPLTVNLIHPNIPEYIKMELLANTSASYIFSMRERNAYPFPVNVHVSLGAENAGKLAMLYSYIEADNSLRLMGTFQVTESGQAMFRLKNGGEYIVIVPDGVFGYIIREGDTLSHIAVRHKIPLNALITANPQITNASKIRIGQAINIPVQ